MGKKTKVGKQRKDKFYHLAKETGYRSRSAFKLLQLNRKFEFLQRARVLIDLCAAPGGWLQVAQKCMPVSSMIIGIDLVPINALPNVITHQEDITSDKCRHVLKKELGTWKADVILNDGAPNVGKNWLHDAFSQAQLTLSALKLAAEFLTKGGWFITKVFRSKDYHALLWVFKLLFKKVHATKPQASRHESAEIFVICQNYIAPDKIDPKFFNPKYLFEEVDPEPKNELNILHPEKEKKKAEGYPEGDYTLHHQLKASEFIHSSNHLGLLANCNEIIFDDEKIKDHKLTTNEIKECCKDIKVLGKADLKSLLNWRKKLKEAFKKEQEKNLRHIIEPTSTHEEKNEVNIIDEEEEDDDNEIIKETEMLKEQQAQELKRKKKKILKQKQKLQNKINLKMVIKDDEPLVQQDIELFRLNRIKKKQDLEKLDENDPAIIVDDPDTEQASDNDFKKRKWISYPRDEKLHEWGDAESESEPENEKPKHSSDSEDETCSVTEENPLLVDLENKKKTAVERWFEKDIFADIENEDDDELELEMIPDNAVGSASNKPVSEDGDSDDTEAINKTKEITLSQSEAKKKKKKRKLDPEGLALGSLMLQSKKTRRDIIESGYNRYTFGDENLPDWFVKDEEKHNRKHLPVTPSLVAEYKARLKEINARPIKKVIEAKSRKKKRALRKLEKARKKAEALTETLDMSEREKAEHIKSIYKRALQKKDKHVTYVVAKKGAGKKVRRPYGVTGKFRVVDRRMKKDKRALKAKRQK